MLVVIVVLMKQIQELLWRSKPKLANKTLEVPYPQPVTCVSRKRFSQGPISKVKTAVLKFPPQKHVVQQVFSSPIDPMALDRSHFVIGRCYSGE